MGLFDIFRRRPPIRDLDELADFIDRNAAFLVQKGIYEYSRARAGHYAKVLFSEEGFREAVEGSRWAAYPLGLAMVAEMVEGVLRPHVGRERQAALDALTALVLSVFDRYAVPTLGEAAWRNARGELERHLALIGIHAPKHAKDIPEPFAEAYFALMPIDRKLRASEYPTIRNYLRVTLCNLHEEFSSRADPERLAAMLRAPSDRVRARPDLPDCR
jgi:hypothetical protein